MAATFFFDENVSIRVAKALRELGHDVVHLLDELEPGTSDTKYLPLVGERGWYLVTQDKKIRTRPHEREALQNAGVGAFIFTGRAQKTTDELAIKLLQHLPQLQKLARKTKRPFIFGISDRGKIELLR